ncbi:type III-B CRISPR module-associated Cmr3 family protein [Nocardia abscessus]|uniref:type III-B CRISPR module-associated Cmr3 family protein n=1 Tax=Nocardia abscessus TaxID=120957 RepID=UPI0024575D62|nr:type III-B CRISPR module-associated Cmr3 family protein [Nocardia abscessus]
MTPRRALVTAILDQPAALGTGSRGDFRNDTYDHIPGSVLRGACAAAWIRRHGKPAPDDTRFAEVFEGTGAFGPLHAQDTLPLPLSARVHKYGPEPGCRQVWWERAYGATQESCTDCGQELRESKGEPTGEVARLTRVHAALDAHGVAEDQKLFETVALAPGTTLSGWVSGDAVAALYHERSPLTRLKLGGGRSTRGGARITIDTLARPEPLEIRTDGHLILRCAAPAVFFDDFGFPADRPSPTHLRTLLGCPAEVIEHWTRWTDIGGWHAASGLPKPVERAVAAGSTYLVALSGTPAPERLDMLRTNGIGVRRREGFGALYVLAARTAENNDPAPPSETGSESPVPADRPSAPATAWTRRRDDRTESTPSRAKAESRLAVDSEPAPTAGRQISPEDTEHAATVPAEPTHTTIDRIAAATTTEAQPLPTAAHPDDQAATTDTSTAYWAARVRPATTFAGWPKLRAHLTHRISAWHPDSAADQRLLDKIGKVATPAQTTAFAELLGQSDPDLLQAILDRIEEP